MNRVRFTSLNCQGASTKLQIFVDLCKSSDVILLQETWVMPSDLGMFDHVSKDLSSFSLSSLDPGEILVERPHGRISIL